MQSLVQAPAYAWGLLFIVFILVAVIGCGIWALTRKGKATEIVAKHPYRRQRTVIVTNDRRRGARAPGAA